MKMVGYKCVKAEPWCGSVSSTRLVIMDCIRQLIHSLCLKGSWSRTTTQQRKLMLVFHSNIVVTTMYSSSFYRQQQLPHTWGSWTVSPKTVHPLACNTQFSCTWILERKQAISLVKCLHKLKCVKSMEEREENCQVISETALWFSTCVFSLLQPVGRALLHS